MKHIMIKLCMSFLVFSCVTELQAFKPIVKAMNEKDKVVIGILPYYRDVNDHIQILMGIYQDRSLVHSAFIETAVTGSVDRAATDILNALNGGPAVSVLVDYQVYGFQKKYYLYLVQFESEQDALNKINDFFKSSYGSKIDLRPKTYARINLNTFNEEFQLVTTAGGDYYAYYKRYNHQKRRWDVGIEIAHGFLDSLHVVMNNMNQYFPWTYVPAPVVPPRCEVKTPSAVRPAEVKPVTVPLVEVKATNDVISGFLPYHRSKVLFGEYKDLSTGKEFLSAPIEIAGDADAQGNVESALKKYISTPFRLNKRKEFKNPDTGKSYYLWTVGMSEFDLQMLQVSLPSQVGNLKIVQRALSSYALNNPRIIENPLFIEYKFSDWTDTFARGFGDLFQSMVDSEFSIRVNFPS